MDQQHFQELLAGYRVVLILKCEHTKREAAEAAVANRLDGAWRQREQRQIYGDSGPKHSAAADKNSARLK
jgi:hypothetical protein